MYLAIEAIRQRRDAVATVHTGQFEGPPDGNPQTVYAGKSVGRKSV